MPAAQRLHDRRRIARGVAGQRPVRTHVQRERAERGFVARQRQRDFAPARVVGRQREPGVGVGAGEHDHTPAVRERFPSADAEVSRGHQLRDRFGRAEWITQQRGGDVPARPPSRLLYLEAPTGVRVQPLDPVERLVPVVPAQFCLRRIRVRDHAKSAESLHVLDDAAGIAAERIRRCRHVEREVVAARRADFDRVEAEDAGSVHGRIG